jgi:N-acetylmuramate 1-kinase
MTRDDAIARWLAAAGWPDWQAVWLPTDASTRRYARLIHPDGRRAILMDMGADAGVDEGQPFLMIAAHLRTHGLAAPGLLADLTAQGVMVIDDLGPDHLAGWLAVHPGEAPVCYGAAVDVLAALTRLPVPDGLAALNPTRAAGMITPLFTHYATGQDTRTQARITGLLQDALAAHAPVADTLSLRDYHAENLIWRPDLTGTDRIGLLDFQDAVAAPAEYDLASLTRDARRDLDPELAVRLQDQFARLTGRPVSGVLAAAAVLAVQRNLRILGVFARLITDLGKPKYRDFLPRVRAHIDRDLTHPALADLAPALRAVLP